MATNTMTFNQAATVLNAIQAQVTGKEGPALMSGEDFATVARTTMSLGYEKVYNALSTVLGKTIVSTRPYNRKFKGIELTDTQFKLRTRKIQSADNTFEDNDTTKPPVWYNGLNPGDGQSVDQQVIKKNRITETNFYGMNTYQDHYTIFDEQLDVAFTNPEEFSQFISLITMNVSNRFEQAREDFARYTILNFMTGLNAMKNSVPTDAPEEHAINLLSEYNTVAGTSFTVEEIYKPDNVVGFMKYSFARIQQICAEMTERSLKYQFPAPGDDTFTRHTPYEDQRIYILAQEEFSMEASVLSSVFNDKYLKKTFTESVSFWQNIKRPAYMNFSPQINYPTLHTADPQQLTHVFGVIFDKDACGYSVVRSTMKPAPYNARGDYRNFFLKDYHKNFNDFTEKAVLLYLEDPEP